MRSPRSQLCERARHWASLRVDGELSELEAALLESHLSRCEPCRSFVREAQSIATALRSVALEPVPAPIVIDFPRRRRVPARGLQAAVAVGLVLVAAALGSALGIANHGDRTSRTAVRHTAMVAMADSPDNLRQLRRPALVSQRRQLQFVPRNRGMSETV